MAEGRGGEPCAKLESAARYAAWAATTPEGKAKHRRGVLFKAPRKLDFMRLCRCTRTNDRGFTEHTLEAPARARGVRAHRPGHRPRRRAGRGELLHLVPRAGQGLVLQGPARRKRRSGEFARTVFGVPLAGCPLEEKISEFHMVKARRLAARRARDHRGGQPDGRGHRPPHLQRLHEVLLLAEAGLHAIVADAVAGAHHRVVDRDDAERSERLAARLHHVELGDLFFQGQPAERHAEYRLLNPVGPEPSPAGPWSRNPCPARGTRCSSSPRPARRRGRYPDREREAFARAQCRADAAQSHWLDRCARARGA